MYIRVPHVCSTCGGQKVAVDQLGLEMVVSCHVGAETQTWVLWKSFQCSQLLRHFSIPTSNAILFITATLWDGFYYFLTLSNKTMAQGE